MSPRVRPIIAALLAALAVAAIIVTGASGRASHSERAAGVTPTSAPASVPVSRLAQDVLIARLATERYATNLAAARAAGYSILTRMIPSMGYHFINPAIKAFDLRKPEILVYEHRGSGWQLGALEWVYPTTPAHAPLPGATYGAFGAACHYVDGTFVFADAQSACPHTSPATGAAFNFWHPKLVTLHFWIWYPNTSGIYEGINPLVAPFH